jgi:hypothetical protein
MAAPPNSEGKLTVSHRYAAHHCYSNPLLFKDKLKYPLFLRLLAGPLQSKGKEPDVRRVVPVQKRIDGINASGWCSDAAAGSGNA